VYYRRADANGYGTGTQQVLEAKTDPEVGVTNFDGGNKLSKGKNFIITGIRFLADTTAATTVKGSTYGKTDLPAALANGEFSIGQKGKDILSPAPVSSFARTAKQHEQSNDFIALETPIFVSSEHPIEARLIPAAAVSAVACYSFELKGIEIVQD